MRIALLVLVLVLVASTGTSLAQQDATTADGTPGTVLEREGLPLPHQVIGSVVRGLTALGAFKLIAYVMGWALLGFGLTKFTGRAMQSIKNRQYPL